MKKDLTLANNPTMDDDYLFASSATDCTGLIPSVAHDEYEVENYEELYPYLPPIAPPLGDAYRESTDYNKIQLTNNSFPLRPKSPLEIGVPVTTPTPEMGIPSTVPEVGMPSTISEVGDRDIIG